MSQHRAVFLDRDGVLNRERGEYTYRIEDIELIDGTKEALQQLKNAGYKLIVVTNQGGVSKGIYDEQAVWSCHTYMQSRYDWIIDDLFFAPIHPSMSQSLAFKPGTLMLERAIALHHIDPAQSWMIGDSPRDMLAAQRLGIRCIFLHHARCTADWARSCMQLSSLYEAARWIVKHSA